MGFFDFLSRKKNHSPPELPDPAPEEFPPEENLAAPENPDADFPSAPKGAAGEDSAPATPPSPEGTESDAAPGVSSPEGSSSAGAPDDPRAERIESDAPPEDSSPEEPKSAAAPKDSSPEGATEKTEALKPDGAAPENPDAPDAPDVPDALEAFEAFQGPSVMDPQERAAKVKETEDKLLSELDSFFPDEGAAPPSAPGPRPPAAAFDSRPAGEPQAPFPVLDPNYQALSSLFNLEESLPPLPDPQSEMGRLRALLIERELKQIRHLTQVVDDPQALAQTLSSVITEAILIRESKDDKLNTVLAPTVEKIFTSAVRRNPENLANQIFPVIGPAIRRSISDTFLSMLQSLNQTLEMSLSLKGLKWRLEAWRVHKPFSEIVLLHTLLYHVEEIYLIHADSGLILDHLVYEGGEARDAELVAAMFTAIRDFIRDSFSVGQKENLDNLRFGERTIYLQRADKIFMACVVRGNPPASLTRDLQDALELMVVSSADELEKFTGDPTPFKKNRRFFQPFLEAQYEDKPRQLPFLVRMVPALALIFLCLFGVQRLYNRSADQEIQSREASLAQVHRAGQNFSQAVFNAKFEAAISLLNEEPGLAVGNVTLSPTGEMEVVCFRDELAADPALILTRKGGLSPGQFRLLIKPYASLDAPIVRERVSRIINPSPRVTVTYDEANKTIRLRGEAKLGWINDAKEKALATLGVDSVDTSEIKDPDHERMLDLKDQIDATVIHFPLNGANPVPEDALKLEEAVDKLTSLEKLAGDMGVSVSLIIYGHADSTGSDLFNYNLSMDRTKTVAALLYAKGSTMPIRNYGMGAQFSPKGEDGAPLDSQDSRKIELRAVIGN
ncbi:MAG: hypothetical protein LBO66_10215 [Deltaproteobacteria bacterium]|jgi:OOP family OmpA-OmpF porin|nr:hypothetical protein [Deltaproteobacteria bacterium]